MTSAAHEVRKALVPRAGRVYFLNPAEYDHYIFERVVQVATRRLDTGAFAVYLSCRARLSADWLAGLTFVFSHRGQLELHEVASFVPTSRGHAVKLVTRRCAPDRRWWWTGVSGGRHAVVMTPRLARLVELS